MQINDKLSVMVAHHRQVHPRYLSMHFRHIMLKVYAYLEQGRFQECLHYLHGLFLETRGGTRRGFPLPAAVELLALSAAIHEMV